MREILFRGKRTDNGEWVDGYFLHQRESLTDKEACYIVANNGYGFNYISVLPETVGQYTGLTDKNGRKIFEGDIVLTQDYYDKPYAKNRKSKKHIGVVEYKIGSSNHFFSRETGKWDAYIEWEAEWIVKIKHYGKFVHSNWGYFFDCEVIGNIHDNPELLEGGDGND